jgi:hypothetical protein
MSQLTKWFTYIVLPAFLFSAVFWVTRLNKVRQGLCKKSFALPNEKNCCRHLLGCHALAIGSNALPQKVLAAENETEQGNNGVFNCWLSTLPFACADATNTCISLQQQIQGLKLGTTILCRVSE